LENDVQLIEKKNQEEILEKTKPFNIPKELFVKAYRQVKAKAGSAGVDEESLKDFERNLKDNLYKLWNRMSSGCYFPPAVKAVPIPKKAGGIRVLGIPTVSDRIAQTVVKLVFEPTVEPFFLADSYGYRPGKSALEAIGVTRQRCWKYNWVLEFDIKGLFDHIDQELLMKAVCKHTSLPWVLLYIARWLKAPMRHEDGREVSREEGTPQGGVISPVLSNLFLHYVFDKFMARDYPQIPWCRYADDGLVHCQDEEQAQKLLKVLQNRFAQCGLELHAGKTKIVYCKDDNRRSTHSTTSFDFLGYTFRGRRVRNKRGNFFVSFMPAVSNQAKKSMRQRIRELNWRNRTDLSLQEIASQANPILRGWSSYYGCYYKSGLDPVWRHVNLTLRAWALKKYKRLGGYKRKGGNFLERIREDSPDLFVHWRETNRVGFA
jgi:RNA-directed DNA polymerase